MVWTAGLAFLRNPNLLKREVRDIRSPKFLSARPLSSGYRFRWETELIEYPCSSPSATYDPVKSSAIGLTGRRRSIQSTAKRDQELDGIKIAGGTIARGWL